MKLSILIPTTIDRKGVLNFLLLEIEKQCGKILFYKVEDNITTICYINKVEIIIFEDNFENSIGYKRNILNNLAAGNYICCIDSDDSISKNYISNLLKGIEQGVDCCSLRGVITWDGERPELFEHSIKYDSYKTNISGDAIVYERFPNHLNCIKSSIVKQIKFHEINHGEDTDFATQIFNLGLIKTEYFIDEVIYHYQYKTNKQVDNFERNEQIILKGLDSLIK